MQNTLERSAQSQKGASMLLTLLLAVLVGLFLMAAVKVVPTYLDNRIIVNAINGMEEETGLAEMRVRDIRENLLKTLRTNNIRDFDPDSVQLTKEKGDEYIDINYESRVPLFYNIEAVVIFENRFER